LQKKRDVVKTIILTLDYELFLGAESGSVKECMTEPISELVSILKLNDSKLTIFWDISHYHRLRELSTANEECKKDLDRIKDSICRLVEDGHDVQMHIHSSWINSEYREGKWQIKHDLYPIHNLEKDSTQPWQLIDYLEKTKLLMEETIKPVKPDYKVTTFRAGGFLLEPFNILKEAFKLLGVKVDSSVLPGVIYDSGGFTSFDYKMYPQKTFYRFENSPSEEVENGYFIEIPITTVKINPLHNFYFRILERVFYKSLNGNLGGTSLNSIVYKKKTFFEKIFSLFKPMTVQFTLDSNFEEKINYMLKKSPDNSVMILHSKLFTKYHSQILKDLIAKRKVRFISLADFIKEKGLLT
jgi:hypothetical protein